MSLAEAIRAADQQLRFAPANASLPTRIVNRGGLANVSRQAHSIQNHIFIFLELDSLGRALGEARRSTSKARL
jgi:hypothetical protein